MTGRIRLNVLEHFEKATADNIGDFGHQVGHFFSILPEADPVSIEDESPIVHRPEFPFGSRGRAKFHVPCRFIVWAFTRWGTTHGPEGGVDVAMVMYSSKKVAQS